MSVAAFHETLSMLLGELVDGASARGGYVLNPGDAGLFGSLDRLSPEEASRSATGGATIAAHVAHLTYGISLMNRWADGEEPFSTADWGAAWQTTAVDAAGWAELRRALREQVERWKPVVGEPRDLDTLGRAGMVASIVHLAYHLGAIRQIATTARGPREGDS